MAQKLDHFPFKGEADTSIDKQPITKWVFLKRQTQVVVVADLPGRSAETL